jgi:hypothetical protein
MSKELLIAAYETKRLIFLTAYIQNPKPFADALAFAYMHRLAPILHQDIEREVYEEDPYREIYAVKADFMTDVLKRIDDLDRAGKHEEIEFYNLEDFYGGRHKRMQLIHSIEYFRIDGRLGRKFTRK